MGAGVDDLVVLALQQLDELAFQAVAAVVCADGYSASQVPSWVDGRCIAV